MNGIGQYKAIYRFIIVHFLFFGKIPGSSNSRNKRKLSLL